MGIVPFPHLDTPAHTATSFQRRELLAASAAWLALPAAAQSIAPWPEIRAALPEARLVGTSRLRVWGFDVYDAQLWVTPGFRASQYDRHPLALSLGYLRALKGHLIAERSLKEMRGLADISRAQSDTWLRAMTQIFPDVNVQDRLTGLHQLDVGARFWLNGQPLGEVADARFSSLFFGIWLAPGSSEPGLRKDLLAGTQT
jgi:hypothetical protein